MENRPTEKDVTIQEALERLYHWQYGGDTNTFHSRLFQILAFADVHNYAELHKAFPNHALALNMWRSAPDVDSLFNSFGLPSTNPPAMERPKVRSNLDLVVRYPDPVENEIADEQLKQIKRFGIQNLSPSKYFLILAEEVGEAAKDVCDSVFLWDEDVKKIKLQNLRAELVQVAAVAKSFIECLDRKQWKE
jgi:NTP pyrophosphatase (non-canonical NTP hydrolase)